MSHAFAIELTHQEVLALMRVIKLQIEPDDTDENLDSYERELVYDLLVELDKLMKGGNGYVPQL